MNCKPPVYMQQGRTRLPAGTAQQCNCMADSGQLAWTHLRPSGDQETMASVLTSSTRSYLRRSDRAGVSRWALLLLLSGTAWHHQNSWSAAVAYVLVRKGGGWFALLLLSLPDPRRALVMESSAPLAAVSSTSCECLTIYATYLQRQILSVAAAAPSAAKQQRAQPCSHVQRAAQVNN
jgi:hypothetical protein